MEETKGTDGQPQAQAETQTPQPPAQGAGREAELQRLAEEMFAKLGAYLGGELAATTDEYRLLERMNRVTAGKYCEMADTSGGLVEFMGELRNKYATFEPFLEKIEQVEEGVIALEQTVRQLDEYSRRLEQKFKTLDLQAARK
mmetsp:Transcript_17407/g.67622  ORF Transcript_17407/g.67622 Transcript_17407/m.67622 type:complete len:143 (-) Transcript_17407:38-466(-)